MDTQTSSDRAKSATKARKHKLQKGAQPTTKDVDPVVNVLYVVLHGLICLVDQGEQFLGALADMGDDHDYLCGDFLIEDTIPNDAYLTLKGVDSIAKKTKENQLDPNKNAVVVLDQTPEGDNYYQSTISLPRPMKIDYFICGQLISGSLEDPNKELVQVPDQISGIRVFTYSFEDYKEVRVEDADGEIFWSCSPPVLVSCAHNPQKLNIAVLHVYNEPSEELLEATKHNKDEFNFTLAYLGAQLRLTKTAATILPNDDPPCGMRHDEILALDRRRLLTQNIMAYLRRNEPIPAQLIDSVKGGGGGAGSQVCGGANGAI